MMYTITPDATMNAHTAPNVLATFVNAPRINVPIRIPSTSPMNPLNHSYADFTPPLASTIATTIAKIPTTTDTKKLNKMMLANGGLSIFIATVFYLIGTGLYVFYQQNTLPPAAAQDQIFASYIAFELPVGITGLLLAAIYAAAQSTLSTGLNSVASSWTLDIQTRLSKKELSFEKQTKIGQYVSLIVVVKRCTISWLDT